MTRRLTIGSCRWPPPERNRIVMLTSTRRRLGAVTLVLLLPLLGACGFDQQTDQVYQPSVGVNNREGQVDVLGSVVVYAGPGKGTFVASLANKSDEKPDKLIGASGEGLKGQLTAPVAIPGGDLVNLADTGAVGLEGESIVPGGWARVTLQFDSGQSTEVNVPVVPHSEEFAEVTLYEAPTPSAQPSAKPSPTATP